MDLAFVNALEGFPEDEVNFVDVSLFSQTDSSFVVHKEVIPCSTRLGHFGRNQVIRHGIGYGCVSLPSLTKCKRHKSCLSRFPIAEEVCFPNPLAFE